MYPQRFIWLRIVLLAVAVLFCGQLASLQLLHGREWRRESENNRLRWVRTPAPRGMILDRKGRVLATNVPALAIWLVRGEVPAHGWDALEQSLVKVGVFPTLDDAQSELAKSNASPRYLPVRLKTGLEMSRSDDQQLVMRLEEELPFLPGVYLREEPIRCYPGGACAAHVLGYLREIDADELDTRRAQGYRPGDRVGKAGIERAFEDQLRGTEGREEVEVDVQGRVLKTMASMPPQPGSTLTLSIDLDVQHAAEAALKGHVGAAVALDPATGDILALASSPGYDLNMMSGHLPREVLAQLRGSRAEMNRATRGLYPPGSVFKIVTAATALEEGKISSGTYFFCNGSYHGIHCWEHKGHGALNLTGAFAHSCNVAFMKIAEMVNIEPIVQMAHRFGLGETVGLGGVMPETSGCVPDPEHMSRRARKAWQLGDTLQVGIGQSQLEVTPLQSARVAAAIANGGKLVHPRLLIGMDNQPQPTIAATPIGLRSSTLNSITQGLRAVTAEGTAKQLDASLHIAGKTGTAQNPGIDHAWFAGYAPAEAPRVAVAVLIEHGGHGGLVAAPIAQTIIRAALDK